MFVLELYFLFYRVPKMMTRLARERGRSALRWSLLGIASWIGAELLVFFGAGVLYAVGEVMLGWPAVIPAGFKALAYLLALGSALLTVTIVSRILMRVQKDEYLPGPPPPPEFSPGSEGAN